MNEESMKRVLEQQVGVKKNKPAGLKAKPLVKSKPRGRPRAGMTADEINESRVPLEEDRLSEDMRRVLAKRVGMQGQLKLSDYYATDTENFHYCWENDYNNKIQDRQNWFWSKVTDDKGHDVCIMHGRDIKYLMKIPMEAWKYFQKLKNKKRYARMQSRQSVAPDEYLPDNRQYPLQRDELNPYSKVGEQ